MRKTIKIGDKELEFEAVATLPIIVKRLFNKNIINDISDATKDNVDGDRVNETVTEIAFVMHKQAEAKGYKEMLSLTIENYYEWLEGFEPLDFYYAAEEIFTLYTGSKNTDSVPKNPGSPL